MQHAFLGSQKYRWIIYCSIAVTENLFSRTIHRFTCSFTFVYSSIRVSVCMVCFYQGVPVCLLVYWSTILVCLDWLFIRVSGCSFIVEYLFISAYVQFMYQSICLSGYYSICLSGLSEYLFILLFIYQSICLSGCLFLRASVSLVVYLSGYLFLWLFIYQVSVSPVVYLSGYLFVWLFIICQGICFSLYIYQGICLSGCLLFIRVSVSPVVYLLDYLFLWLSEYLFILLFIY